MDDVTMNVALLGDYNLNSTVDEYDLDDPIAILGNGQL